MSRGVNESQPGDSLYVVEGFLVAPKGEAASIHNVKEFFAGHRVKCVSTSFGFVTFEFNGVRYTAADNLFVTKKTWKGLMAVFGEERVKKDSVQADNSYDRWMRVAWAGVPLLIFAVCLWFCTGLAYMATGGK